MLALSVRSLTIAYFVLSAAFAAVSESLDDAARSAGASWWTAITRITLPILRPALFAAFILMFISILNDYDPALFLVTPGHELMGVTMLLSEQQGVERPGRGAGHGAGRDHGRRDRRRRAAVLDQIERTPECLRSPCRA